MTQLLDLPAPSSANRAAHVRPPVFPWRPVANAFVVLAAVAFGAFVGAVVADSFDGIVQFCCERAVEFVGDLRTLLLTPAAW